MKHFCRQETEGDTANPGTAGPIDESGRSLGSAPEQREQISPRRLALSYVWEK
jgi:hypothetical protein